MITLAFQIALSIVIVGTPAIVMLNWALNMISIVRAQQKFFAAEATPELVFPDQTEPE
jgi:hypothetical protein